MKINDPNLAKIKFHKPAIYRIKVSGKLNKNWEDRLGGLCISDVDEEQGITTLQGKILDQAGLTGVLNAMYESHFSIISVMLIENINKEE